MLRRLPLAMGLLAMTLVSLLALQSSPAAVAAADEPGAATLTDGADDHSTEVGAHEESPGILDPQIPLAFWTLIVFVLLFLILRRFAWGPLSKALNERERNMEMILQRADAARAEGERLLAEHNQLMQQANQQAQAILDEARRGAEANAEVIRKTARDEAESTLERARREIETARDHALLEVWGHTAELAVSVAGKVLDRELREDDHRRLIEVARNEMPAAPNGTA